MRPLLLLLLLPLSALAQTDAQPQPALTLEDCLRIALARSPDVAAAGHRLEESRAQYGKTFAPFSPQGTFSANQIALGYDLAGAYNNGRRFDRNTRTASVNALWNVFNGFRDWDRLKSAGYDRKGVGEAYAAARQATALQTVQAYYGLLLAGRAIEVQEENLKSKREHFQLAKVRYQSGLRPYSDVLNAQIQLKQGEIDLLTASARRDKALHALNILLDRPLSAETSVVDTLEFLPVDQSLDAHLAKAYAQRPEIKQARDQAESARYLKREAVHELLPALSVGGLYNYNLTPQAGVTASGAVYPTRNPYWAVNAGLTFNFWDGGTRAFEIKRARNAQREAEDNLLSVKRRVAGDVSTAFSDAQSNQKIYQIARDQVSAAREDLTIVGQRYKNGSASVLEVVDAQANLLRIELDLIGSLYSFHIAKLALLQAVGGPLFTGGL